MGEKTTCDIPSSTQAGTTSASMTRQSMECSAWFETSGTPSSRASAAPAWISSARHSETPMYSALPARTTSAKAWMVSSSGVS